MYYNFLCGYQSALMAPTEILAVQHYNNMRELFKDTNVVVELLTGSITKKDKMPIYEDMGKVRQKLTEIGAMPPIDPVKE
jgi:ATP-dependent DNA helicase RecG